MKEVKQLTGTAKITIERYDELKEIERIYKSEIESLKTKHKEETFEFHKNIAFFCKNMDDMFNNDFIKEINECAKKTGFTVILEDHMGRETRIGDGSGKVYRHKYS